MPPAGPGYCTNANSSMPGGFIADEKGKCPCRAFRGTGRRGLRGTHLYGERTIERITSQGSGQPRRFWYDQPRSEWVTVLKGSAGLRFEGISGEVVLREGDWIHIPAHRKHRVEWTSGNEPTVWLAVHHS